MTCAEPEKKPERETSTPYESLLVTISQAVPWRKSTCRLVSGSCDKERKPCRPRLGLSSVADSVWTGNHLKMVRFVVENKTLSALNIGKVISGSREFHVCRDVPSSLPASYWQVRAWMCMSSVTGEATDGQYQYHCETQSSTCGWGLWLSVQPPRLVGHCILSDVDMSVTVKPWLNRSLCRI